MIEKPFKYPRKGETCAFAQDGVVKRAAVLFDRVEPIDFTDDVPREIRFYVPEAYDHSKPVQNEVFGRLKKETPPGARYTSQQLNHACRDSHMQIRVECHQRTGYTVVPVYDHQRQFLLDFPVGQQVVYQAAIENLPEIVEESTSWEQILNFRQDKEAARKYRELRFWLRECLQARSVDHASDIIYFKVEQYEWALRKHGFKTATGAISSILDWKALAAVLSGSGVAAAIGGGPIWSAIAGGLIGISRVTIWLAERLIERKEIARGAGSEVAIIYEAKKKLIRE